MLVPVSANLNKSTEMQKGTMNGLSLNANIAASVKSVPSINQTKCVRCLRLTLVVIPTRITVVLKDHHWHFLICNVMKQSLFLEVSTNRRHLQK
jgi:hypothetical protein